MNFTSTREGILIALEALRSNKVRAFLTILGVVIGVATVSAMAAIITGMQETISADLEAVGAKTFILMRFDQTTVRMSGPGRPPWEGKPKVTLAEGAMLSELPSVGSVTPSIAASGEVKYGSHEVSGVQISGNGVEWPTYTLGDFAGGRNFLPADYNRAGGVAVIFDDVAKQLFAGRDPVGRVVRVNGVPLTIVGVYKPKPNLFAGGSQLVVVVPTSTAIKYLKVRDDWMQMLIVPAPGFTQDQAIDDVTMALRTARMQRPAEESNFALVKQEALVKQVASFTGVVETVMLVLASIGLMVGGVGVVGIMMISVTERTREIGVRKALGATRREILWQFLVEAMTVTVIGGVIGLALGGGGALLLKTLTPIPAHVPLFWAVIAIGVSAACGILFGMYPANKAARLDPVDALRYE
ncbi:MAG TPA: ABC transporter permease [Longimicrobiaceae bacterium]|jgi:putative ABC transport system permease protein|nr:ABC transporter permease [Longimicrobiaceae bacterium]